ncbi:glucosaminidase domain-containing protein [Candidatus Saccharibacteria bacterium]|nr:glucosaminidase domain-containing protein [Candidatus Saccharibacteria bacterium]
MTAELSYISAGKKTARILTKLLYGVGILIVLFPVPVSALSDAQKKVFQSGIYYFNTEETLQACGANSSPGGSTSIPSNLSPSERVAAFVKAYGQMAYNDAIQSGVPWEVTQAQAIVESAFGDSAPGNNFFGIKASSSWTGPTQLLWTTEVINGSSVRVQAKFRVYASAQESFNDHSNFLRTNSNYSSAFQYSNNPIQFITAVAAGGYATAPDYAQTVGTIVQEIINFNADAKILTPSSQIQFNVPPVGSPTGGTGDGALCGGGTTTSGDSSQIVGDIGLSSDSVACATGTKDLGVVTSQYTGTFKKDQGDLKIRLCQIPNIPGVGNDVSGTQISGGVTVNSRVSGAWFALGEAAKAAGMNFLATSSFRLANSCGGTGDGDYCARPGQSPHQLGVAIDFGGNTYIKGSNTTSCSGRITDRSSKEWVWLYENAEKFGFKQYSAESWHWDPLPMNNRCGENQL